MTKAVIFDCDGTLVDSEVLGARAMHKIAVGYGCTLSFATFVQNYLGRNMATSIEFINQHSIAPMPEHFATEARAAMALSFRQDLQEVEGAKELLTRLKKRGIPMAVATNGPRAKAQQTLGLTGLLPFFENPDRLFSGYDFNTFKPDPQLFLQAAQALGFAPADCLVVEDSLSGLQAALAAGMQAFSLVDPAFLPQTLHPTPVYLPRLLDLEGYV